MLKRKMFCQLTELEQNILLRHWQTRTHCCRHTVADTNVSPFARARHICCGHKFSFRNTKKCLWFCSETFWVYNKCFPVCAAQETSWATMCPQQCVLIYQGLKADILPAEPLQLSAVQSLLLKYLSPPPPHQGTSPGLCSQG